MNTKLLEALEMTGVSLGGLLMTLVDEGSAKLELGSTTSAAVRTAADLVRRELDVGRALRDHGMLQAWEDDPSLALGTAIGNTAYSHLDVRVTGEMVTTPNLMLQSMLIAAATTGARECGQALRAQIMKRGDGEATALQALALLDALVKVEGRHPDSEAVQQAMDDAKELLARTDRDQPATRRYTVLLACPDDIANHYGDGSPFIVDHVATDPRAAARMAQLEAAKDHEDKDEAADMDPDELEEAREECADRFTVLAVFEGKPQNVWQGER